MAEGRECAQLYSHAASEVGRLYVSRALQRHGQERSSGRSDEERRPTWVADYTEFESERGARERQPEVEMENGCRVDLYTLLIEVVQRGGLQQVVARRQMSALAKTLEIPVTESKQLGELYRNLLLAYEEELVQLCRQTLELQNGASLIGSMKGIQRRAMAVTSVQTLEPVRGCLSTLEQRYLENGERWRTRPVFLQRNLEYRKSRSKTSRTRLGQVDRGESLLRLSVDRCTRKCVFYVEIAVVLGKGTLPTFSRVRVSSPVRGPIVVDLALALKTAARAGRNAEAIVLVVSTNDYILGPLEGRHTLLAPAHTSSANMQFDIPLLLKPGVGDYEQSSNFSFGLMSFSAACPWGEVEWSRADALIRHWRSRYRLDLAYPAVDIYYNFENFGMPRRHRRDYRCLWCSVAFADMKGLLWHFRTVHTELEFKVFEIEKSKGDTMQLEVVITQSREKEMRLPNFNCDPGFVRRPGLVVTQQMIQRINTRRPEYYDDAVRQLGDEGGGSKRHNLEKLLAESLDIDKDGVKSLGRLIEKKQLYHSATNVLIQSVDELAYDSEDEIDDRWLLQVCNERIDELVDVAFPAKEFMKLWNKSAIGMRDVAYRRVPAAVQAFVDNHGRDVVAGNMTAQFSVFADLLINFGLLALQSKAKLEQRLQLVASGEASEAVLKEFSILADQDCKKVSKETDSERSKPKKARPRKPGSPSPAPPQRRRYSLATETQTTSPRSRSPSSFAVSSGDRLTLSLSTGASDGYAPSVFEDENTQDSSEPESATFRDVGENQPVMRSQR